MMSRPVQLLCLVFLGITACGSPPTPPPTPVAAPARQDAASPVTRDAAIESGSREAAAPQASAATPGCTPAQLAGLGEALEADLDLSAPEPDPRVLAITCKPWPSQPGLAIASILYAPAPGNEDEAAWATAVMDAESGRVLSTYRDFVTIDAAVRIHANSLQIDTAAYRLAPGVTAFGIRKHISYSPQCADGGIDDLFTLFVHDAAGLRPVLAEPELESWSIDFSSGHHPCGPQEADYRLARARTVLRMLEGSSNGYHDIEFDITVATSHENINGTVATYAPQAARTVARFDGTRYALPDWSSTLDRALDDALVSAKASGGP